MSSYCDFARFYDELTENVEYEKRCKYIKSFLDKYNITGKVVLDLACGTCSVSLPLAKCGYKIIGVDLLSEYLKNPSDEKVAAEILVDLTDIQKKSSVRRNNRRNFL